ncbi:MULTISPECIES: hypothetical protein [unclassified Isoptericola]|uniref:hypothetical protein n=1 Tax=unclassified Isoptericola TaxID=2623355 RepID=UPI002713B97F|nr:MULTISPECIES: hypothetical protein [unclassified Isoptericola]MDO8145623.1 hypothetical protein [Isoptericola sp. 178]MDO8149181.1 hypothetical protein [Isoptericola sp. b515]
MTSSTRSPTWRLALSALATLPGVVAYVVIIGYLDLHVAAVSNNARLDWTGTTFVSVMSPPPHIWLLWPGAAVALVTGLAVLLAWRSRARANSYRELVPLWTATLTLVVLTVWLVVSTELPYNAAVALASLVDPEPMLVVWLRLGALSIATYAFAGAMIVLSVLPLRAAPTEVDPSHREDGKRDVPAG